MGREAGDPVIQYNPGMQCGLVESLCLNSFPCLEKKEKNPAAVFHKCVVPFRMLLVAGLEGEGLWAPSRQWSEPRGLHFQLHPRGRQGPDLWPVPQGVKAGAADAREAEKDDAVHFS